jgi:hypothetical protein
MKTKFDKLQIGDRFEYAGDEWEKCGISTAFLTENYRRDVFYPDEEVEKKM